MPLISGSYNPAVGIIINVAVMDSATMTALQSQPSNAPNLTQFSALVDTGASITCISSNAAQTLQLQPSGKTQMSGSTGQGPVNQYTFGVGFLFGAQQNPTGTFSGHLGLHLVQGCEFTNHGFGFDVLLGRDIICKGSLHLSFNGQFTLAF